MTGFYFVGICSRIVGFDNVEESLVDASIAFEFEFIFRKFLYDKPNHEHVYEIDFVHNVFREYFAGEYLLTLLNDLNAAELNQLLSKMETFPEIFSATLMESDDVFSSMILKASKIVYCDRNLDDFADRLPERNKADICFQNWNWNLLPSFVVQSFKYMTEVTFANCIFPSFTIDKSAELNISTLRLVDTQLTVDEFAELISIKSLRLLIVRKCDIRWVKSERLTTCEPNFNSFVYQAPDFASLPADLLVTCIHQKLKMFWLEMPNESETQILSRAIKIDGLHMCITDSTYESDENTIAKRSPKIIISLKHRQVAESIYRRLCEMVKSNELRIKNTADVLIASPAQLQHKWYIFAKKHLLSNANSNSGTDS